MASPSSRSEPIAIVGMAFRFPQDAISEDGLWHLLFNKKCAMTEYPPDRVNISSFYNPDRSRPDTLYSKGGHFLREFPSAFDAPFFSITAAEAEAMDPQQRLGLETTFHALENAGLNSDSLNGSNTSVHAGSFSDDYKRIITREPNHLPHYAASSVSQAMLSNRISWFFNLQGPSVTIDTACSSSMIALDLSCQGLRAHDADIGVVLGSNLMLDLETSLALSNMNFLSPDSKCYSFDHRANGYGRGEGVGVLIIKRLSSAIQSGDTIRAIIRATSSGQDGRTPGITQPSPTAQESLIRATYSKFGLDMNATAYVEAHGTGTEVGDPIEATAIANAFEQRGSSDTPLYIGSIKSNLGHLEGCSGVAGIIKAVLMLERSILLPNANFEKLNPHIEAANLNIKVVEEPLPWPTAGLRRVSVSSFGFGGANSHAVLDDAFNGLRLLGLRGNHNTYPGVTSIESCRSLAVPALYETCSDPQSTRFQKLLVLSASDQHGVERVASLLSQHVDMIQSQLPRAQADRYFCDLLYTLSRSRCSLTWRSSAVIGGLDDIPRVAARMQKTKVRATNSAKLAFCFTGQGAQVAGMGKPLLVYPVFTDSLQRSDAFLKAAGCPWSLLDEMFKKAEVSNIDKALFSQPLCTALQIALVDLLRHFGVVPSTVVGHSSGEIAAAYAAGAISHNNACRIAYFRGECVDKLSRLKNAAGSDEGMISVGLSQDEVAPFFSRLKTEFGAAKLTIACINSPTNVTVSGTLEQIDWLKNQLDKLGIFCRKLNVDIAYHSPQMQPIAMSYLELLTGLKQDTHTLPNVRMVSSVTGEIVKAEQLQESQYWVNNLLSPVRFSDALSRAYRPSHEPNSTSQHGITVPGFHDIVEIGPHSALRRPILDTLRSCGASEVDYHAVMDRAHHGDTTLLETAGRLFCKGHIIDLLKVNVTQSQDVRMIIPNLPQYPFDHSRHFWQELNSRKEGYRLRKHPRLDLLGTPSPNWNPLEPRWTNILRVSEQPWISDHQVENSVLYPAAGTVAMALEAVKQLTPDLSEVTGYVVRDAVFARPMIIPKETEQKEIDIVLRPAQTSATKHERGWEFKVYALESEGHWQEKSSGVVSVQYNYPVDSVDAGREALAVQSRQKSTLTDLQKSCTTDIDPQKFYQLLKDEGLAYGPSFQAISSIKSDLHEAVLAEIDIYHRPLKEGHMQDHVIHPITLDAIIHSASVGFSNGLRTRPPVRLPTRLIDFWIRSEGASFRTLETARICVQTSSTPFKATFDVFALDTSSGETILSMKLETSAINRADDTQKETGRQRNLCYEMQWMPDLDLMDGTSLSRYCRLSHSNQKIESEFFETIDLVMLKSLQDVLGTITQSQIASLPLPLQRYMSWAQDCYDRFNKGAFDHCRPSDPLWQRFSTTPGSYEEAFRRMEQSNLGNFYTKVAHGLPSVLKGEIDATQFMFQDDKVEVFYNNTNLEILNYDQFRRYMDLLTHKDPSLKFLEIGAGTGSVTSQVLNALESQDGPSRFAHFDYTDISPAFFDAAQERCAEHCAKMTFRTLDVEKDPREQGFECGSYDVVIAGSVLHATRNLENTLRNTRALLKPGGKLILVEIVAETVRMPFAFGLFPGWWLGEEEDRRLRPWISSSRWHELMLQTGFSGIDIEIPDYENPAYHEYSMLIATAVEEQPSDQAVIPVALIFDDQSLVQSRVAEALSSQPHGTRFQFERITPQSVPESSLLRQSHCISLLEVDKPIMSEMTEGSLKALQQLVPLPQGFLWVSGSGKSPKDGHPLFHTASSLAGATSTENAKMAFTTLGLEDAYGEPAIVAERIMKVFKVHIRGSEQRDVEYLERDRHLCIHRIRPSPKEDEEVLSRMRTERACKHAFGACPPVALKIGSVGLLETMHFVSDTQQQDPPPPGMVDIKMEASGVNFRDCLTALGQIEANYIGFECAGVVARVPENSPFSVGDRVAGYCQGSYQTFVRTHAGTITKIPGNLAFNVAAASIVAFSTAWESLINVGRLTKGETVLIHSATGGTGQAAIQIAQYVGAEVYATVGSLEKKALLKDLYHLDEDHIFASRDLTFKDGILRQTLGKGVDVILNSLSGDSLLASWDCIAKFGRFVEIGIRDIVGRSQLPMWNFRQGVTFSHIALDLMLEVKPARVMELADQVLKLIADKTFSVPSPLKVMGISEVQAAFRLFQGGGHYGKMVVEMRPDDLIEAKLKPLPKYQFRPDRTYLVIGGFGGIGRSITLWMADKGAKNFLILSRSGGKSRNAQQLVDKLTCLGIRIEAYACDTSDRTALAQVLADCARTMPPIAGCIQAAMALHGSMFGNMTLDAWEAACRPKIQASWNLHTLLPSGLDFVCFLSSLACIIGSAGQSNYIIGNAWMDELARHRNSLGEKTLTLNLGWVAEEGVVAEDERLMASYTKVESLPSVSVEDIFAILDYACDPSSTLRVHQLMTGLASPDSSKVDVAFLSDRQPWLFRPLFRELLHTTANSAAIAGQGTEDTGPDYVTMFCRASSFDDATQVVIQCVRARLAGALSVTADDIDMSASFDSIGVDSLFGIELRNFLARRFDADVPVFQLMGTTSATAACAIVAERSALKVTFRSAT